MKRLGSAVVKSVVGIALAASCSANGKTKDATATVHPASAANMVTVTVSEVRSLKHHKEKDVVIAQAAGFANDTCDVITTFDVVKNFEERQTWKNVKQKVEIVVDGKAYPAKFRDFGFYPLGLNLACIDFESPSIRAGLQMPALPLEPGSMNASMLSYDDGEIAKSDPGTPLLNKQGEVSAVLIATPGGPLEFASAEDIRMFLLAAEGVSPWPTLHQRALTSI